MQALDPLPPRAARTDDLIFRLTVDQYHDMIRTGTLTEDDPVELLDGILVYKMPKNSPHRIATTTLLTALTGRLPEGWHYQAQDPITLPHSEPEPDGTVVRGRPQDHRPHPRAEDVALVIEVADASLPRDATIKLRLYAAAGIPTYWLVNLPDRRVEVYTDPDPAAEPPAYRRVEHVEGDATLTLTLGGHPLPPLPVAGLFAAEA